MEIIRTVEDIGKGTIILTGTSYLGVINDIYMFRRARFPFGEINLEWIACIYRVELFKDMHSSAYVFGMHKVPRSDLILFSHWPNKSARYFELCGGGD